MQQLSSTKRRLTNMKPIDLKPTLLAVLFVLMLSPSETHACSMYKVTVDGKTMVGCNHDAWLTTSKIWFVNAPSADQYGAAFTGAREVSGGRTTPQSGMNTEGLVFSRLTSYHPERENAFPDRLKITDEADYLTGILQSCATVDEVKRYIEQYDHSRFLHDVFIYVDTAGNYLVVEPYSLTIGTDPNYVLANFCPSITSVEDARELDRFRNGQDFLSARETSTSLEFCRELSDTMHVDRKRNGDGTLLTSIWNTQEGEVSLYFYHDYDTVVSFNLSEELAKGDHVLDVPELFPRNAKFERLVAYKTPSNTIALRIALALSAALLALIALVLIVAQLRRSPISLRITLTIGLLNVLLVGYTAVLFSNKAIFYFDAPYQHYSSSLISASSYLPFILLLAFVPLTAYAVRVLKSDKYRTWTKVLLVINQLQYLLLLVGFGYWGLFNFWN
ncbi:hypothetical protein HZ996_05830 [Cryomorphaceae bacterium]|nr:hypothetical protein HZ996_05830 [Cryomorphaceae bacterium]